MLPETTGTRAVVGCASMAVSAALMFPAVTSSAGVIAPRPLHNTTARITASRADAPLPGLAAENGAFLANQERQLLKADARRRPPKPRPKPSPTPAPVLAVASAQAPAPVQTTQAPQPSSPPPTQAPPSPPPVAVNGSAQQYAESLLGQYGWSDAQMLCLLPLWTMESGWNYQAQNPSSGAYGIPQALPGSKMASAGADWQTNADTQVRWGLGYIQGSYGSPCGAWSHEQADGWY